MVQTLQLMKCLAGKIDIGTFIRVIVKIPTLNQRNEANTLRPAAPFSVFLCRCWWRRLLPATLPALPSDSCDQFGRHCPLLCPGWRPLLGLPGLLQKCRLLHEPDTAWAVSHPALVWPWLVAGPVCSPVPVASNSPC